MEDVLIRQKYYNKGYESALEDFIDSICNNKKAIAYACTDLQLEYCDGDHCDLCLADFRKELNEFKNILLEKK